MVHRDSLVFLCDLCLEGTRAFQLFEMCGGDRELTIETNAAMARALTNPEESAYIMDAPPPPHRQPPSHVTVENGRRCAPLQAHAPLPLPRQALASGGLCAGLNRT